MNGDAILHGNPALDLWRAAGSWEEWGGHTIEGGAMSPGWRSGMTVADKDRWRTNMMAAHRLRGIAQRTIAWAVPTDETLDLVAGFSPIVEVGAGLGYWTAHLRARGADVVAYDDRPHSTHPFEAPRYGINPWAKGVPAWSEVRYGTPAAASVHPDRTLLMVWPPYAEPMASMTLRFYRDTGGQRVVWIGEGDGGCCGDDAAHLELAEHWMQVAEHRLPQWEGLHDWLTVYERKAP